jgi:hypothetical protein
MVIRLPAAFLHVLCNGVIEFKRLRTEVDDESAPSQTGAESIDDFLLEERQKRGPVAHASITSWVLRRDTAGIV